MATESVAALPLSKAVLSMEIDPPGNGAVLGNVAPEDWRNALNKVVPAVVVLRTTATRAFDTEAAGASYATGFVVDKSRGILLTNRHVVRPGPIVAEAMFLNREEIPVYPVYRDPVHDFGFLQFDPGAVQFMEYEEIPLAPEAATVGLEIRVVGNDSGEKVSILAGTLARLDRDAPHYKKDGYNDFNTFYMQAASGTKGGSSGSPVIDCKGRAVALNAGSKSASASAFFLPLERVVRALKSLQQTKDESKVGWRPASIPRGTLQMTYVHKGYDETRRLGLKRDTEQTVREASPAGETGMLVVDSVVPGGPAHKQLEPGDVLVRVNGEVVTQFLKLETLLDDNVGKDFELEVERGGLTVNVTLKVQDLHSITPSHFLEVSGGVLHALSYQQARNFRFTCGLVYVAEPGYMLSRAGVPKHAIIKKMAGEEILKLENFIAVYAKLARGARVPLEFQSYADRHRSKSVLVTIDRHEWYAPPLIYTRNDATGLWHSKPAIPCPSISPASPNIPLDAPYDEKTETIEPTSSPVGEAGAADGDVLRASVASKESGGTSPTLQGGEVVGAVALDGQPTEADIGRVEPKRRRVQELVGDDATTITDNASGRVEGGTLSARGTVESTQTVDERGGAHGSSASLAEHVIEPTLVMIEVHIPPSAMLDGVHSQHFFGTGLIVHHSQDLGLVVVDKNTVAISVSDVMLAFAAYPMEIPAEVVFLHPVHNFAIVAYDPSALGPAGAAAVKAAVLLPEPALRRGDSVYLVGLSRSLQATSRKSVVTNPGAALNVGAADCPRYRAMNMEVIELDTDFGHAFSGVLADELGRVQALWGSFSTQVKYGDSSPEDHQFVRGIPVYPVSEVVEKIINGCEGGPPLLMNGLTRSMPLIRILEVELYPTLLSKARSFGLSDKWVQALVKKDPVRRQVLRVKGCLAGSKAEGILEQGDMLLAISGEPVTCFRDVENACQRADASHDEAGAALKVTVFRQGVEMELLVETDVRDGFGTTRMVNWAGCVIQDPHPAVRALGFLPEEGHGVYVARWCQGSPVHRYGLYALQWIVEVNGRPTPDLQTFIEVTEDSEHGAFVRVKTVHLNGKPRVLTLKQDLHYWPTWELRLDCGTATWRRRTIKSNTNLQNSPVQREQDSIVLLQPEPPVNGESEGNSSEGGAEPGSE
ncbi:pro-apoptotic serine protease NMA111 [Marchantia polymorpha subsp. ruderalis]|uniref:Pro-apoptotic serine protease NMA111 n=2 Tax=Marchantia polymorpha TaxID=3197 RepID=A0AAF6BYV0_MARPO|nr:hypothetical protein MARPO_0003s0272 [Marchantia polymorpha]PTQ49420.1 hypothetical protein MARPO_0003s0272 [Marchantia polymorpha]BBN17184.1 hypothetical protein Mp_7g12640 [Marchantia polymorpha subsp. ruderalis]BBN17185.1 hypothetical protein Mp_7g12640 [Marchantia polymorpha subsp. ruderalis]|eukprot:PTQ49418.1 hypothetical protein MARPO_0003s0272 [Marchantia polymorpha]